MNKFDITPLPPIPRFSQFRNCSLMEDVGEMRVREGQVEVVTLLVETNTPRRRTLSESYEHVCSPIGEHPRARRKRLKAPWELSVGIYVGLRLMVTLPTGTTPVFFNTTQPRPGHVSKLPLPIFDGHLTTYNG